MCGILGIFKSSLSPSDLRGKLIECSSRLRHRGPDWSGYIVENGNAIGHERLAIIDPESGAQPLISQCENVVVAANGEIYNYKELLAALSKPYNPRTGSDCEAIIPLYLEGGMTTFPSMFRGMFSVIIYDRRDKSFYAFRDHIGKTPMYYGYGTDGSMWFGSEMKSICQDCTNFKTFPPGHYYSSKTGEFTRWYTPTWLQDIVPVSPFNPIMLRNAFETAVKRRMMSDVPWGVLLSGGLDSSLVAAIASRCINRRPRGPSAGNAGGVLENSHWFPQLHSFCVGLENSPDAKAAKEVADFLGTVHHNYTYTIQEGLDAIREVIYHIETYDVTTIRAGTAMFLMSRKIKAMGIKMVLSGEGSDEIFGGYLYFHKCPNPNEMQAELRDKIAALHLFDCARANKTTSAWGLEARTPFLDADFLDHVMNINPAEKMVDIKGGKIEKYILRKAFDTPEDPYLPHHVLYRQKEQFSDGVGYGWIDALRDNADKRVTDQMFSNAANRYPENTPQTKEAYLYRSIFEEFYPQVASARTVPGGPSIACSTARAIEWDASFKNRADCSGRAVAGVHDVAYDSGFVVGSEALDPAQKKARTA